MKKRRKKMKMKKWKLKEKKKMRIIRMSKIFRKEKLKKECYR
jgi:hypothetical protein